jgi:hypothetical protein
MITATATTSTSVTPNRTAPRSILSRVIANASPEASTLPAERSMTRLTSEMPVLAQLINPATPSLMPPPLLLVPPAIGASPTNLFFATTQGGAHSAAQTLSISNTGGGTLTWSASDNAGWLTLSPSSGTTTTEIDPITLSINTASLTAKTYTALITFPEADVTAQTISVTLTVSAPATQSVTLQWSPDTTDADLAGYKVYQTMASGAYPTAPIAIVPQNCNELYARQDSKL